MSFAQVQHIQPHVASTKETKVLCFFLSRKKAFLPTRTPSPARSERVLDFCVVGGGIVGLATARALLRRFPGAQLSLLEQETTLARHQTGHNSGVIHSGIYYTPGSLKARLCKEGAAATKAFCTDHGIAVDECGKFLVATSDTELQRLENLLLRAAENGIACTRVDAAELRRREQNIAGLGAIFVPSTAIVDYRAVSHALAAEMQTLGGSIRHGARVTRIEEAPGSVTVHTRDTALQARILVVCAGTQADRLVACAGGNPDFQIVPFRGEYFRLPPHRSGLIGALIYPVPDPKLPFLGIHLTRMIDGSLTVGPNAVLGLARERYGKFAVSPADLMRMLTFPGFWKLIAAHSRSGLAEMRNSLWKRGYLAACQRYCPSLTLNDLLPMEAGIRAQAVMRDGTLVHDFLFHRTNRCIHVCNAPSPAATSALPIADMITDEVAQLRSRLGND
jgi:L-2-hydroxyglutarate oxidase